MCGIVGAIANRDVVPLLVEGLKRLEYRGYDSAGVAVLDGTIKRVRRVGRVAEMESGGAERRTRRPARHRAHPLGDARRRHGAERASARVAGRGRGRPQRHRREPRGAARAAEEARLRLRVADRHRGRRAPHPLLLPRDPRPPRRHAARGARSRRCVRDRGRVGRLARVLCLRARGLPAAHRPGRRRELRRVRRVRGALRDATRDLPRGGRRGGREPRRRADLRPRRPPRRAQGPRLRRLARLPRARPLPPLHAEGDPRAAEGARRLARADPRRRREAGPVRRWRGRGAARRRRGADPRLRHQLLRRLGRALLAGVDREDPHHRRDRERVPLPRLGPEPAEPRRHDLAVGRDPRHDGGAEARAGARPGAHARDLQRARERDPALVAARVLHPRRRRDRRRLDQGVHDPARGAIHADPRAREAERPARAGRRGRGTSRRCGTCRGASSTRSTSSRRSAPGRSSSRTRRTRSSSAAASTTRSRSRARSS